jgi:hypothetical protein
MMDSAPSDRTRRGAFFVIALLIVIVLTNVGIVAIQRRQEALALPSFLRGIDRVALNNIDTGEAVRRQEMSAYYLPESKADLVRRVQTELKATGWNLTKYKNQRPEITIFTHLTKSTSAPSSVSAEDLYLVIGPGKLDDHGGFLNPNSSPKTEGSTVFITSTPPTYGFSPYCSDCRIDQNVQVLKRTALVHPRAKPPTPTTKKAP